MRVLRRATQVVVLPNFLIRHFSSKSVKRFSISPVGSKERFRMTNYLIPRKCEYALGKIQLPVTPTYRFPCLWWKQVSCWYVEYLPIVSVSRFCSSNGLKILEFHVIVYRLFYHYAPLLLITSAAPNPLPKLTVDGYLRVWLDLPWLRATFLSAGNTMVQVVTYINLSKVVYQPRVQMLSELIHCFLNRVLLLVWKPFESNHWFNNFHIPICSCVHAMLCHAMPYHPFCVFLLDDPFVWTSNRKGGSVRSDKGQRALPPWVGIVPLGHGDWRVRGPGRSERGWHQRGETDVEIGGRWR